MPGPPCCLLALTGCYRQVLRSLFQLSREIFRDPAGIDRNSQGCGYLRFQQSRPVLVRNQPPSFPIAFEPRAMTEIPAFRCTTRSEEHTSELQSPYDLVCRLL